DIGMLGRYMFTSHNVFNGDSGGGTARSTGSMDSTSLLQHKALPPLPSAALSPLQTSSPRSTSDTSTATSVASVYRSRSGKGGSRKLLGRGDSGLGISVLSEDNTNDDQSQQQQQSRVSMPLSPLAESQEIMKSANSSTKTLDTSGSALTTDGSHPPLNAAALTVRGRTGSLGIMHQPSSSTPQLFQQSYVPISASVLSPPLSRPRLPSTPAIVMSGQALDNPGSRLSQSLSTTGETILEDNRSDRSSISDSLSIRYRQPSTFGSKLLSGNFPSLNRGVPSYNAAMTAAAAAAASLPKYNRLSVTPVPLGPLMAKGSYRFAKIQFTLPPITDMSPVSSVFLDFDYTVDIAMTLGGNFGTTKKAAGKLPLKIVTIRTAAKVGAATENTLRESAVLSEAVVASSAVAGSAERRGSGSEESTDSVRDSLSCLNLSIASSDDNANLSNIAAAN
ncbi:hypothetical protein GGI24_006250, partial [Coemansia furcata]